MTCYVIVFVACLPPVRNACGNVASTRTCTCTCVVCIHVHAHVRPCSCSPSVVHVGVVSVCGLYCGFVPPTQTGL